MKGYLTHEGWMGWTGYKYELFETEEEYYALMREE